MYIAEFFGCHRLASRRTWTFHRHTARRPSGRMQAHTSRCVKGYRVQAGCPQSQPISASFDPASLQSWLQYFSPDGGIQTQDRCAHFLAGSFAMKPP